MKKSLFKFIELSQDYYRLFNGSKTVKERPLAWVTAFTPVEILAAMDIDYIFPESYAAVISASGKEQEYITRSLEMHLDRSVCSYSTAFNGSYFTGEGPKGTPAPPDLLIAANNQCNTLPGWWNYLSGKLNVPLFVIDYPGELNFANHTREYIKEQHARLIDFLTARTSADFNEDKVKAAVENSRRAVESWEKIAASRNEYYISPQVTFDYIFPLVIRRCDPRTADFYPSLYEDIMATAPKIENEKRVLWMGYPLWYDNKRYFSAVEAEDIKIVMDDYSSWWNLDYTGESDKRTWQEILAKAYNSTILNQPLENRQEWIQKVIDRWGIDGLIFNLNRSCKRAAALNASLKDLVHLPAVVIETDMVDRTFSNPASLELRIDTFKEMVRNGLRH
jgi:benzoyl-CoA reductase/2-hydroxyglutaryl-CoA dehydratase subunit BcrC/BadD/HgdB